MVKRTGPSMVALALAGLAAMLATGTVSWAKSATARGPVIIIGVPGLRWTDVSPAATPSIWRLAEAGSVGSLAATSINIGACPGDGWLTLNSGTRATSNPTASPRCPRLPSVRTARSYAVLPGPATIPAMTGIVATNRQFRYQPYWGVLSGVTAGCATAIGPGA